GSVTGVVEGALASSIPKAHLLCANCVLTIERRNVRVTVIAVNSETMTPVASVKAKPLMIEAPPNVEPNQNRMAQVMSVEALESRMDGQAWSNPASTAAARVLPVRNSSLRREKISTF